MAIGMVPRFWPYNKDIYGACRINSTSFVDPLTSYLAPIASHYFFNRHFSFNLQTFMVPRRCILLGNTLTFPLLPLWSWNLKFWVKCHGHLHVLKGRDICVAFRMNCNNFGDPRSKFQFSNTLVYDQAPAKLITLPPPNPSHPLLTVCNAIP